MAYSFIPPGSGSFGGTLGGYGSLGAGQGLFNALGSGLNLAQAFRRYQNANILDQYQIPAQAAEATRNMWGADFGTLQAQEAIKEQQRLNRTGGQPGPILDASGNLVSQPLMAGTNQLGAPYTGMQPFSGVVQNNVVDGRAPTGVSNPQALSQYLTLPVNTQPQTFDPRYLNRGFTG